MDTATITHHNYGYTRTIAMGMDEAVAAVTDSLKEEGFGVLMTLDVQTILHEKLGVARTPYKILGACNPHLANQALTAEAEIGLLLPCNVVVYTGDDSNTVVSAVDPESLFKVVGRAELEPIAAEVSTRLRRAIERLP